MFPHEVQELLAKILFLIFSISLLCVGKIKAEPIDFQTLNANNISKTYTLH
jgi:hypothetical protein